MMAPGHVASGVASGIATSVVVAHQGLRIQAAWVAIWTGFVLLPDWDSPNTKVARMWGPVSGGIRVRLWRRGKRRKLVPGITDLVAALCGGHRQGSHSVLGLLVVLAGIWVATWSQVGTAVVAFVCAGLVLAAIGTVIPGRDPGDIWQVNLAVSVFVGWAAYTQAWTLPGWLPLAAAGGAAVHVLGDMITVQGCPLSWPTGKHRVSLLPLRANGFTCCYVLTPLFWVATVLQLAYLAGYHPIGAAWVALTSLIA